MSNSLSQNAFLKNLAEKYVLKGEKYRFGGPVYYNNYPYWIIYYVKGGFLKKPTSTCLIILDENYRIVTDRDVYNKITLAFLYPRPTSEFLKVYNDELKEISVIHKFFSRSEKFVGRVNVSQLEKEIYDPKFKEITATIKEIIEQSYKIEKLSNELLQLKESTIGDIKNLLVKLSWKNMDNFVKNVVFKEYELLTELTHAFIIRSNLLKKLVGAIEKIEKSGKLTGKLYLLFNDAKTEIKAIEGLNLYLEKFIKIREGLQAVCEVSRQLLEDFLKAMKKRLSSFRD